MPNKNIEINATDGIISTLIQDPKKALNIPNGRSSYYAVRKQKL